VLAIKVYGEIRSAETLLLDLRTKGMKAVSLRLRPL
jgi:hypothetical protein